MNSRALILKLQTRLDQRVRPGQGQDEGPHKEAAEKQNQRMRRLCTRTPCTPRNRGTEFPWSTQGVPRPEQKGRAGL